MNRKLSGLVHLIRDLLLFLSLSSAPLFSLEYALIAKRGQEPPTSYAIYSERCSGSNFFKCLITNNLQIEHSPLGHKHFPPWFSLPESCWQGPREHYTFSGKERQLFFLIVRNPYDWAQSLHKRPWCADPSIRELPLEEFIRAEWVVDPNDSVIQKMEGMNPLVDRDFHTGNYFSNLFKLRAAKLNNMMIIEERVSNFYMVAYEAVREHPEEVLKEIAQFFSLAKEPIYTPVEDYKGDARQGKYERFDYPEFPEGEKSYIQSQLDLELEAFLGYYP